MLFGQVPGSTRELLAVLGRAGHETREWGAPCKPGAHLLWVDPPGRCDHLAVPGRTPTHTPGTSLRVVGGWEWGGRM